MYIYDIECQRQRLLLAGCAVDRDRGGQILMHDRGESHEKANDDIMRLLSSRD